MQPEDKAVLLHLERSQAYIQRPPATGWDGRPCNANEVALPRTSCPKIISMSRRDIFHDCVRRGLEKESWFISSDPLELKWQDIKVKIDIAAEKLIAAERGEEKIAVEVKSFISPSPISDFHTALGQFLTYRLMLEEKEPERELYLAVPKETYKTFFRSQLAQAAIKQHKLKIIVYNPFVEEIVQWIG